MNSDKKINFFIITFSAIVLMFLTWLIYFKSASATDLTFIDQIPVMNAAFNTLTSAFLIMGIFFVKKQKIKLHKVMMIAATISSVFFLIGYIAYHYFHGDSKFVAIGIIRPIYFSILISHIALSAVQVPLILSTLYLGFTGKTAQHKKIARFTFPIWLYVSLTGVLIFIFLRWFNTVV
jgi:putative membrane protein